MKMDAAETETSSSFLSNLAPPFSIMQLARRQCGQKILLCYPHGSWCSLKLLLASSRDGVQATEVWWTLHTLLYPPPPPFSDWLSSSPTNAASSNIARGLLSFIGQLFFFFDRHQRNQFHAFHIRFCPTIQSKPEDIYQWTETTLEKLLYN